ncbi:hypothetical protein [Geomonas edaphica]|uniref:hypothetical protein n=1 Tax=Geomonas edaphica TaxID=2570226 RepID=UPI0010A90D46|nr:hypothetical protein [Geomonas edaphica]
MSPALEAFVVAIYERVKGDYPDHSSFQIKTAILDATRAYGSELADTMVAVHVLSEQVKALTLLAQYA